MSEAEWLLFARVAVGAVFIVSAVAKLRDPLGFGAAIADFELISRRAVKATAYAFAGAEVVVVILLAIGEPAAVAGFVIAILSLAVFAGALASALRRGLDVSCNCFGRAQRPLSVYDIARNGVLILLAALGVAAGSDAGWPGAREAIVTALMGVAAALLLLNLADVVKTLTKPFPLREAGH